MSNPTSPTTTASGSPRLGVGFSLLVLLLALGVRLIYWAEVRSTELYQNPLLDAAFYDAWAMDLAGLKDLDEPVHHQAPLFPYLLSIVYRLFGHQIDVMVWLQFLMGAMAAVLIGQVAGGAFGSRVGRVAALLAALYTPFFFNEATIMPTALNLLLQVIVLRFAQAWWLKPGFRAAALVGVAGGVAYLCRAEVVLLLFFFGMFFLLRVRFQWRLIGTSVGGAFLGILPFLCLYGFYYQSHTGDFRVLPSSDGLNLYLGNNPESKGTAEPPSTLSRNRDQILVAARRLAEEEAGRPLEASEISRVLRDKALDFITGQPKAYFGLLLRKAWLFVHGKESCDILHYDFVDQASVLKRIESRLFDFRAVGPFALLGLLIAIPYARRGGAVLYLLILDVALVVLLFSVSTRYRLPAAPAFLGFAAFSLVAIWQCLRSREKILRGGSLLFLAFLLFGLVNARNETLEVKHGQVWINISTIRQRAGDLDGAELALRKSIDAEPEGWKAWQLLGQLHFEREEFSRAESDFKQVLTLNPGHADSWLNLGVVQLSQGRAEDAVHSFKACLQVDPDEISALLNLAIVFADRREWTEALTYARQAERVDGGRPDVMNQLAWVLLNLPERSSRHLAEAVRLAEAAAKRTENADLSVLDTLEQCYRAAGKSREAEAVREKMSKISGDER